MALQSNFEEKEFPNFSIKHAAYGHHEAVSSVKFSPNGKYLASSSADGNVLVWDVYDKCQFMKCLKDDQGLSDVAWNHKGDLLVTASDDKTLKVRKFESDQLSKDCLLSTLKGHNEYVLSCNFSRHGDFIVSGSYDKTIRVWDVERGQARETFDQAHADIVNYVDVHRNDQLILSCSNDGSYRIFDIRTEKCTLTHIEKDGVPISHAKFSPNGKFILAATLNNTISLYDVKHELRPIKTFTGHKNEGFSIFVNFCGKYIISGSEDKKVYVWDLNSEEIVQRLSFHNNVVIATATHPTQQMIASGGLKGDNNVVVWENYV